jgi:hypothetical protein
MSRNMGIPTRISLANRAHKVLRACICRCTFPDGVDCCSKVLRSILYVSFYGELGSRMFFLTLCHNK